MQRRSSLCLGVAAAALLVAGSGCGSSGTKVYKVTGKVTLDGQPVVGAAVHFEPFEAGDGVMGLGATGTTGTDGVYNLTTYNTNDGALAGQYKVTVTKTAAGNATARPENVNDPNAMMKAYLEMNKTGMKKGAAASQPANSKGLDNELPQDYSTLEKTPLRVKVPGGTYDFALKKGGGT